MPSQTAKDQRNRKEQRPGTPCGKCRKYPGSDDEPGGDCRQMMPDPTRHAGLIGSRIDALKVELPRHEIRSSRRRRQKNTCDAARTDSRPNVLIAGGREDGSIHERNRHRWSPSPRREFLEEVFPSRLLMPAPTNNGETIGRLLGLRRRERHAAGLTVLGLGAALSLYKCS